MTRVAWGAYTGEDMETALAILLNREFSASRRIRPAQGDKGIDILIPTAGGKNEIWQVKKFATALTASHKRQITKSWERLRSSVAEETIEQWWVARPIDATLPDDAWLAELTKDAPFPCGWKGLTEIEALAAKYPDVIDYYFDGGRERLAEQVRLALSAASLAPDIGPSEAADKFRAIYASTNGQDPHYRYAYRVDGPHAQQIQPSPGGPGEGLVLSLFQASSTYALQVDIYARYPDAVEDRPVPGTFLLKAAPGSEGSKAITDFHRYGTPVSGLDADVELDIPGGFAVNKSEAKVWILPTQQEGEILVMRLFHPDGLLIAESDLRMKPFTAGLGGGMARTGVEVNGAFRVQLRYHPDDAHPQFGFKTNTYFAGKHPSQMLPGMRTLQAVVEGNRLDFAPKFAPAGIGSLLGSGVGAGLPNSTPFVEELEALIEIQKHTSTVILMPDGDSRDDHDGDHWLLTAAVLRGETVFTFTDEAGVPGEIRDAVTEIPDRSEVTSTSQRLKVKVGDDLLDVGQVQVAAARRPAAAIGPAGNIMLTWKLIA